MSRKESRRDFFRKGKSDIRRDAGVFMRSRREKMRGSHGRDGRPDPPRRLIRAPCDRNDGDYQTARSRSYGEDHKRRSISRERPARSPQVSGRATPSLRSPRVATRGMAQARERRVAKLPIEQVGRHPTGTLLISSRNGTIGRQIPHVFISGSGVEGVGDVLSSQADQSSINSNGMLVPRSLILEDGTVQTFYTLPPDPSLESMSLTADDGLRGKLFAPYVDPMTSYGTELRYQQSEEFHFRDSSRGALIAIPDGRVRDGVTSGHNQIVTGDGALVPWPGSIESDHPFAYLREVPPSPHRNAISHKGASKSPLSDKILLFGREVAADLFDRNIYAPQLAKSAVYRGVSDGPEFPSRGRLGNPSLKSSAGEDPRIGYTGKWRLDEMMPAPEDQQLSLKRDAQSVYPRDNDSYADELLSLRDNRAAFPKSSCMSEYMEASMYVHNKNDRQFHSQRRDSAYRSDMDSHVSPRSVQLSLNQGRALTPPRLIQKPLSADFYMPYRMGKRKYTRPVLEFMEHERPFQPDDLVFKRKAREQDLHRDDDIFSQRNSEWGRRDGYLEGREKEDDEFCCGYFSGCKRGGDESGSSRLQNSRSPDIVDGRRMIFLDNHNADLHSLGKKRRNRKEGGSFAERNRLRLDNDMQHRIVQEDEQQILLDLPEDSPEFKQRVYRAYMKYAKTLNENPGKRKRYEEQGKAGMLLCLACSRLSKTFVDTHSLVMHTYMSQKRVFRAEHLGLCKAICTLMGWNHVIETGNCKSYQHFGTQEAKANKEDLILWPPAVVIHNASAGTTNNGQEEGGTRSAVKELLKGLGLSENKVKIVDGRQGAVIVKYLGTFSCLHEAESLHQHFLNSNYGREDWLRVQPPQKRLDTTDTKEDPDFIKEDTGTKQKNRQLYGYLALAHDLEKVDMDFRRRCLVKSRKEIAAIADDPLMDIQS